jgi:hypothetical protein
MRGDTSALDGRAVLVEMGDTSREPRSFACAFQAIRTSEQVLIESTSIPDSQTRRCVDGLIYEHYDLATDPFELENLIPPPGGPAGAEQLGLLQRLDRLRACSGIAGRDPLTAGGYCE